MSKLERLLKLLALLLDAARPLTADELRNKLEAYPENQASFRRAFERDKDDLRSMGVDLLVETVPGTDPPTEGYRVDANAYAGQDPGLEPDELAALHLAAALVRFDSVGADSFWKLGGVATAESPDAIAQVPTSDEAAALYTAVSERRVATFGYREVQRNIEPARLSFRRGHWYVSGFDQGREDDRTFRLDRIEGGVSLGEPDAFTPSSARGPELTRTWELGDAEPVEAHVLVDAAAALWTQVHLRPDEVVEHRNDGGVVVAMQVRNVHAFRDWVLGFMDAAEVLSPPELRQVVVDWLQNSLEAAGYST